MDELIVSEGKGERKILSVDELSLSYSPYRLLSVSVLAGVDALRIKDAIIYLPLPALSPMENPVELEDLSTEELDPREPLAALLEVFPHRMRLDLDLSLRDPNLGRLRLRAEGSGEEGILSRLAYEYGELAYESQFILRSSPAKLSITPEESDEAGDDSRILRLSAGLDTNPQTARIEAYNLALSLKGAELELFADRNEISLEAAVAVNDLDAEIDLLNRILPGQALQFEAAGSLSLEATLESPNEEGSFSVAEASLQAPRALIEAYGVLLQLEAQGLKTASTPLVDISGSLRIAPPRWELHSFSLSSSEGLILTGEGVYLRDTGELRGGILNFDFSTIAALNPLVNTLVPGDYPLGGSLEGSLSLEGILPRPDIGFRLEGEELELDDLALGALNLEGDYTAGRLRLSQATISSSLEDPFTVDVVRDTDIRLSEGEISLSETSLRLPGGRMSLEAAIGEENLFLDAESRNFKIDLLRDLIGSELPLMGTIDWRISASGSPEEPLFEATVEARELLYRGLPLDLMLSLEQTRRGINLRRLDLNWNGRNRLQVEGALPLRLEAAGLRRAPLIDQELQIISSGPAILGLLSSDREESDSLPAGFRFRSRLREEDGLAALSGELTLDRRTTEEADLEGQSVSRIDLTAALDERPGERMQARVQLQADGESIGSADGLLWLPLLANDGEGRRFRIEADAQLSAGLGLLTAFVPSIIYAEGQLEGDVSIEGPLFAPELDGELRIDRGGLRLTGSLPALTAIDALMSFDREELRVESLRGEAGLAPFSISGRLNLPGSRGSRDLELMVEGDNLLLYSDPDMRLRADTELEIGGSLTAPRISGRLQVSDAEYTRDYPLLNLNAPPAPDAEALQLFSLEGEAAADSELDISLRADESILIDNNILSGRASLDLDLSGSLQVPMLTGRAFLDEASLRLPVTTVALNRVTVEFPQESPFQPRIQAQGQSRVGEYEIFLQVAGTMPGIEIELSTAPPLPQDQALLLLAAGITGDRELDAGGRTIRPLGTFVGRRVVETIFGDSEAEQILVERVDVAIGGDFAENGVEVLEVEFQLDREENWFIRFQRDRLDQNSVGLAWRLWFN